MPQPLHSDRVQSFPSATTISEAFLQGTRKSIISLGAVISVGPQFWRAVIIDGTFQAYDGRHNHRRQFFACLAGDLSLSNKRDLSCSNTRDLSFEQDGSLLFEQERSILLEHERSLLFEHERSLLFEHERSLLLEQERSLLVERERSLEQERSLLFEQELSLIHI